MKILTKRLLISLPSQTPLADSSPANPSSRSPAGAGQPRIARNALPSVPSFREGVGFEGEEGVGDGLTKRSGRRRSGGTSPHEPEKKKRSPGTGSANTRVLFPPLAFPTRVVVQQEHARVTSDRVSQGLPLYFPILAVHLRHPLRRPLSCTRSIG
jgi:hypothetical protein